jgi:hypothetical protein
MVSNSNAVSTNIFTKTFNEIVTAFNDCAEDDHTTLNQCITRTRALLKEPSIPRYFRIRCYLQLPNMVGDIKEANEYHHRATLILRVTRSHEVKGQTTAEIDATLDHLEASVEKMRKILGEEGEEISGGGPEQYDSEDEESDVCGKAAKAA